MGWAGVGWYRVFILGDLVETDGVLISMVFLLVESIEHYGISKIRDD